MLTTTDIREVVVARNVTHSSPFQVASQLASLAAIAPGRVLWRPQVSADHRDAAVVGGSPTPRLDPRFGYEPTRIAARLRELFADAEAYVRTVKRLWATTSSEPGPSTDHSEFERYRVAGPLPLPVASPPPTAVLAHHALEPYRLAAAIADRVFVTPTQQHPIEQLVEALEQVQELIPDSTRPEVYLDIAVVLGDTTEHAARRSDALDTRAGQRWSTDTSIQIGTAQSLAEQLNSWREAGVAGVRLRPAIHGEDDLRIISELVPLLAGYGAEAPDDRLTDRRRPG